MSGKLKPKQKKAAHMMALGKTAVDIAMLLKVRPETISRWKKIPEFMTMIEVFMEEEREAVRHRLAHLVDASISAIWTELHNQGSDSKRLRAALNVIKMVGMSLQSTSNRYKTGTKQIEILEQHLTMPT